MILVNVKSTWLHALAGRLSAAESTLGRWYQIPDRRIEQYGEAIAGVFRGRIVSVFDIEDYTREDDHRVTFVGSSSPRWAHLVGTPTPDPWLPGQGRPVKYLDTDLLSTTGDCAA
jgi:hypothetical protein